MKINEAIEYNKNLREYMRITDKKSEYKFLKENYEALQMAIKSLEAWKKVENICTIQVADTFRNFKEYDRGSHAREKIRNTCREITILLKEVSE